MEVTRPNNRRPLVASQYFSFLLCSPPYHVNHQTTSLQNTQIYQAGPSKFGIFFTLWSQRNTIIPYVWRQTFVDGDWRRLAAERPPIAGAWFRQYKIWLYRYLGRRASFDLYVCVFVVKCHRSLAFDTWCLTYWPKARDTNRVSLI